MRHPSSVLLALAAFACSTTVHGVYRCTGAAGAVTYQDLACPADSASRVAAIPSAFPEANIAERERLLQRAAAADDRLLRRLEIEAAERIARDERIAREKAAEAARLERERNPPVLVYAPARWWGTPQRPRRAGVGYPR